MKIVFFGTPPFAARILQFLVANNIDIAAIVTRPDKPKGRSLHTLPSAVKEVAGQVAPKVPLFQPLKASTPEFAEILRSLHADLFVVAAYGEIIKQNLLDMPRYGCINVHPSLLPKYRGAAPIQRCLMNGDSETGVCIMKMALEMDAGDILEMARFPLSSEVTFGELDLRLSELSGPLLLSVIGRIANGRVAAVKQDPAAVTFAPKIRPEEEILDWKRSAKELHNLVRALSPSPSASCWVEVGGEKKRLKIKKSEALEGSFGEIGSVVLNGKGSWMVACGSGALKLLEVQLEGKRAMPAADFLRGLVGKINFLASNT